MFGDTPDALNIDLSAHHALEPRHFRKALVVRHEEERAARANQIRLRVSIKIFAGKQVFGRTKKRKGSDQRTRAHASDSIKDWHRAITFDLIPTTQECRTKCTEITATRNDEQINGAIIAFAIEHAHDQGATGDLGVSFHLLNARITLGKEDRISLRWAAARAAERAQRHAQRSDRERAQRVPTSR